jgi:hypothetical protein
MSRKYTNKLLEMVDEGSFDPKEIMTMALNALSEDDVEEMCRANDLVDGMGLDDDDELDFNDDGQPDEAQEWHDYDPDC